MMSPKLLYMAIPYSYHTRGAVLCIGGGGGGGGGGHLL